LNDLTASESEILPVSLLIYLAKNPFSKSATAYASIAITADRFHSGILFWTSSISSALNLFSILAKFLLFSNFDLTVSSSLGNVSRHISVKYYFAVLVWVWTWGNLSLNDSDIFKSTLNLSFSGTPSLGSDVEFSSGFLC
jgi:hypothetical protein